MRNINKYISEKLVIDSNVKVNNVIDKIKHVTDILDRVIVKELKYNPKWFCTYKVTKDNFIDNDDNNTHHITVTFREPLKNDEKKLDELFKILEKELKSYKIEKGKNTINGNTKFIIYLQ